MHYHEEHKEQHNKKSEVSFHIDFGVSNEFPVSCQCHMTKNASNKKKVLLNDFSAHNEHFFIFLDVMFAGLQALFRKTEHPRSSDMFCSVLIVL